MTLKLRIIVAFSVTFSLVLVGAGVLITAYSASSFQEKSIAYCNRIVSANIQLMDRYFEQLSTATALIASDKDVIDAVNYRNNNPDIDYTIELNNQRKVTEKIRQLDLLTIISNIAIIGDEGRLLYYYGPPSEKDFDFSGYSWFPAGDMSGDMKTVFTNFHDTPYLLNDKGRRTVSIITPIFDIYRYKDYHKAYLMCDFDLESLLASDARESEVDIAIYDGKEPVYFPQKNMFSDRQIQELNDRIDEGEAGFRIGAYGPGDKEYIATSEKSQVSGWQILGIIPQDNQFGTTISWFTAALILISVSLIVLLAILISRSVWAPVNQLVEKFKEIGAGNFRVRFEKTGMAELDTLSETSQKMAEDIERLNEEIILEQKKMTDEQVKALQHQINPHFLNNVLQSIKSLAICGDTAAISKLTTLLGKVLSYAVYLPYDLVGLRDELSNVENYIEIQNVRYGGLIRYEIRLDPENAEAQTPKLIILPIVENAIEHGFQPGNPLKITISVVEEGGNLCVITSNDGAPISRAQLKHLKKLLEGNEPAGESESIGLLNVNARLKRIFGAGYGLDILDNGRTGATVVLTIPNRDEVLT